jgi:hypothetical protein
VTDELDDLLDQVYVAEERVSSAEIQRKAVAADLPADLLTRVDALPEGEYDRDEAFEILHGEVLRGEGEA